MQEIIERASRSHVSIDQGEGMKLLFRAVTGKENTLTELFCDNVLIKIEDIVRLNAKLEEKLGINHSVTDFSFSATLNFSEGRSRGIASFGDLLKFDTDTDTDTDTDIDYRAESAIFRWDYNIQFPGEEESQPHSIVLRVSSPVNPMLFLQAMLASDPEEFDIKQKQHASIVCVINFKNAVLSQELMNIVSGWVKSRGKLESVFPVLDKHRKMFDVASVTMKSLVPAIYLFVLVVYANMVSFLGQEGGIDKRAFLYFINYVVLGFFGYKCVDYLSKYLAGKVDSYYAKASRLSVMGITAGDMQAQNKSLVSTTRAMYKTAAGLLGNFVLNVICGVVATYICVVHGEINKSYT